MAVNYKILFEVKVFHEYYLTTKDGATIFEQPTPDGRKIFLKERYERADASVGQDLQFDFPDSLKEKYESYYLKVLPAYSGFKVAIRVNKKTIADDWLVYEPLVSLPNDLVIYVRLIKKNGAMDSYTNTRVNSPVPGAYFFSNEKILSDKSFPFLTNDVSGFNANYTYEQGELVSFGANDIRGYFQNSAGDQWQSFTGTGFVNENDRLLVPAKFQYSFPDETDITEVTFDLKNSTGATLKSITGSSTEKMKKLAVDFSDKSDSFPGTGSALNTTSFFSLDVSGSNGYMRTHRIFFSDLLYNKSNWGVVGIVANPTQPDFKLIDTDGYLLARKRPGEEITAPVFELPVKSRFAYWRYTNERGKTLDLTTDLNPCLAKQGNRLVSIRPHGVAATYFRVSKEGSTDKKYLPNPVSYELKKDDDGRFCFDITVPTSDLFPII